MSYIDHLDEYMTLLDLMFELRPIGDAAENIVDTRSHLYHFFEDLGL